jgi:thiol-disulfide isomerase/thioredoxin
MKANLLWSRAVLMVILSLIVMAVFSSPASVRAEEGELPAVGDTLAPFMLQKYGEAGDYIALRDYCGEPRSQWKSLERRPVVLSFFAKWCQPCRKEIPELEELSKGWNDKATVFLISVGDSRSDIDEFLSEVPTQLPILMDPYKNTSTDRYGVSALPTLIVLDQQAVVRFVGTGYHEETLIHVDTLVKQQIKTGVK